MRRGGRAAPRETVEELVDRLGARLGERRVLRAELVADARPERSFHVVRAAMAAAKILLADRSLALAAARPVRLFEPPRAVTSPAFRVVSGPERVETGWWEGAPVRRDYFAVEDREGTRLWAFRTDGAPGVGAPGDPEGWVVHGSFA